MASGESGRDAVSTSLPAVKERSVLSSPRVPTPPSVPSRLSSNSRWGCGSQAVATSRTNGRASQDPQLEQLSAQNAHLREELQSLREMYAKHTAYTELKCERQLREKDQECTEWYKQRRDEMEKMRAGCTVMHALFSRRERRLNSQMKEEQHHHEQEGESLLSQVERHKRERQRDAEQHKELVASHTSTHASELDAMRLQIYEAEAKASRLASQLEDAKREINQLKDVNQQKNQEVKEAQDRLSEVAKRADIDRRSEQIESLEAELKATRKRMKEGWKKDVESLRQELMDYVRFIVHILPENWCETEAAEKVPPDLKDQLAWMSGSKSVSPVSPASPGKGNHSKNGQGFLPSTDLLAKSAICGGQHARPGGVPTSPARKRATTST